MPPYQTLAAAGEDDHMNSINPETAPLLAETSTASDATNASNDSSPHCANGNRGEEEDPRDRYRVPVVVLTFSIIFILELGIGVSWPAWNALLEAGICSELHPESAGQLLVGVGDDNPLCKDPAVQGRLAMYRGWSFTLESLPTILLAVFYGGLSDRWGRKPVGLLCTVGLLLTTIWYEVVFFFALPMWTTLLQGVFLLIGGGPPVGISMLYTMLADVIHVDNMASVLFRFNSVFLVAELLSNPVGGFLLGISPWLSLIAGNIFMIIALVGVCFLPETLKVRRWHDAKARRLATPGRSRFADSGDHDGDDDDDDDTAKGNHSWLWRPRRLLGTLWSQICEIRNFLVANRRVAILIVPFVFVSLGKYVQELLLQYAAKRYGWSWSQASYFLTLKSASFFLMLTLVLPALSTYCRTRLRMSPLTKDLWLARWSGFALILADLAIALAYSPALLAVGLVLLSGGCGLAPLLRSLLVALVEPSRVGALNTAVGFLETLGVMVAAPAFAWLLQVGIAWGAGWVGLPFGAAAVVAGVSAVVVFLYRIPGDLERVIVEEDHAG